MSEAGPNAGRTSSGFSPVPLLAMALLAAGVAVKTIPLESSRPQDAERRKTAVIAHQDVEGRLWQDPFALVDAEIVNLSKELGLTGQANRLPRTVKTKTALDADDQAHDYSRLHKVIAGEVANKKDVSLLGAMVFGGSYPEDTENRRRNRYAVVSGLLAANFGPDDPEHIGYIWTRSSASVVPKQSSIEPKLPEVVPYEWFTHRDDPNRKVLLLWLDDSAFSTAPLNQLSWLVRLLACREPGTKAEECAIDVERRGMQIVGPAGSDNFVEIFKEARRVKAYPHLVRLEFFSPYATVEYRDEHTFPGAWASKCFMTRTIGGDDALIGAVIDELQLRRVLPTQPSAGKPPRKKTAVLAITERDTSYSHALGQLLEKKVGARCGIHCVVLSYSYLRGLDGMLPDAAPSTDAARRSEGAAAPDVDALLSGAASRERAYGRSQYDYLRRVATQIETLKDERGDIEIKAIGIFGNDVYDKLIVLQALRDRFPHAVFFTTDLDARFLQHEQSAWTRNLVVASNFGFALNPGIQSGTLPFRDGYQTAGFLATRLALLTPGNRPSASLVHSWLGEGGAKDHQAKSFGGKRLYEIGRTRAVELDANGAMDTCKDPATCTNVHALREYNYPRVELRNARVMTMVLLVVILLLITWRRPQQWLGRDASWRNVPVLVIAIAGLVLALYYFYMWIKSTIDSGTGEPFLWLEGVSLWPAELVRLISIALSITFVVLSWRAVRRTISTVESGDFALAGDSTYRESMRWSDLWISGPLLPFDDAAFEQSQRGGSRIHVARLWAALRERMRVPRAMRWIGATTLILVSLGLLIERIVGEPFVPNRGELVQWTDRILEFTHVLAATLLLVTVVYIIRTTRAFILRLAHHRSAWPDETKERFAARLRIPVRELDNWIDFRLLVELSKGVSHLIYYPFVILALAVIVRSSLFDATDLPLSLQIMIAVSLAYAVHSAYALRRAAEHTRSIALRSYNDRIMQLAARSHSRREQIEMLMDRIRNTHEGPFSAFSQQPVIRAILIPLGGFGGASLIEYLTLAKL